MEHRAVTDVATGSFRLRKSDQHAASSTIVDMDNDELVTLTTVEVSDGVVLLHCLDSSMTDQEETEDDADDEAEEESEEESEEGEEPEETEDDEDEEEEEEEEDEEVKHAAKGRTYTVASGNSSADMVRTPSASSSRSPLFANITGSTTTIGRSSSLMAAATASTIAAFASIPVLVAWTVMSAAIASICAVTKSAGSADAVVTP